MQEKPSCPNCGPSHYRNKGIGKLKKQNYTIKRECRKCRKVWHIWQPLIAKKPNSFDYVTIYYDGKSHMLHRCIWEKFHNKHLPKDWLVHHINGIKYDNRPENLIAIHKQCHNRNLGPIAMQQEINRLEEVICDLRKELSLYVKDADTIGSQEKKK